MTGWAGGVKLLTKHIVHVRACVRARARARICSTMLWCGLQQAGTLHGGNRLLILHNCWCCSRDRIRDLATSIITESTYLTLNMIKIWGCFKVQVG